MQQSLGSNNLIDSGDGAEQVSRRHSYKKSRCVKNSTSEYIMHSSINFSGEDVSHSTDHYSVIIQTNCGFLYPILRSIRSPQIEIYGLKPLSLFMFRSASVA